MSIDDSYLHQPLSDGDFCFYHCSSIYIWLPTITKHLPAPQVFITLLWIHGSLFCSMSYHLSLLPTLKLKLSQSWPLGFSSRWLIQPHMSSCLSRWCLRREDSIIPVSCPQITLPSEVCYSYHAMRAASTEYLQFTSSCLHFLWVYSLLFTSIYSAPKGLFYKLIPYHVSFLF